jgi:hypothetical protein
MKIMVGEQLKPFKE